MNVKALADTGLCLIRQHAKAVAGAITAVAAALASRGLPLPVSLPSAGVLALLIVFAIPNRVCDK